ncbi:MAG: amidohydrolase [Chloroflexi bacterium]|nr:amidohydrolase [Chloroflexota bacterium]
MKADLILYNGLVHTLDNTHPQAQAVALYGGRIVAVGRNEEVRALAGRGTPVLDLAGRTVVPGFTDSHVHFLWYAVGLTRPNLDGAKSLEEALARLAPAIAATPPGEWVLGFGWNHEEWPVPVFPTRQHLDAIAPAHPVALRRKDGHSAWVNSLALKLAGISRETPDPPGGQINRDASGEPTGILRENAMDLLYRLVPEAGPETFRRALPVGIAQAHAAGLTGIHDMEGAEALTAFQTLHRQSQLTLRVRLQIPAENLEHALALGMQSGLGDETLRLGGVKMFADGSLGSQTAWMLAPFEGQPENYGLSTTPVDELAAMARRAAAGGIANREVLDIYAALRRENLGAGLRQRIEHVQLLHPADVGRLAALGVVASMQPIHATSDRYMADRHWGARSRYGYAWRSLLDAGTALAFGSDCPVETLDPLQGLYAAVTRQRADEPDAPAWYPAECLTPAEALRAYTVGAAYATGDEGRLGRIATGYLGDLVVLSQDVLAVPPAELLATKVDYTIFNGQVVHERK